MTLEEAAAKKVPILKFSLRDALTGDPKHNVPIQGGDSILVSKMPFFFVMGEVRNPGKYNLERGTTVLRAISMGGGLRDAGEEVVIIRPNNPQPTIMTLEEAEAKKVPIIVLKLKDVLDDDPKHNLPIQGGDSILVSKMPFFFVTGEVKNPGKYNLERGTTVLMGISMGGGLTAKAAPGRTKIVREKDGKRVELRVKMETLVLPGDTIVIPESFF
jgi:polysaccharide biosynthesis/export protein